MKYIIDIPDNTHWIQWIMEGTKDHHPYMDWKQVEDLTPYTEHDRKDIEYEVWEFASILMNMHPDVAEDIYWSMNGGKGIGVAAEMTYQEAKSKYEAWLKQKNDIRVGDEVTFEMAFGNGLDNNMKAVALDQAATGEEWCVLTENGCVETHDEEDLYKTGRHFPEVAELLEKMRGDSDD